MRIPSMYWSTSRPSNRAVLLRTHTYKHTRVTEEVRNAHKQCVYVYALPTCTRGISRFLSHSWAAGTTPDQNTVDTQTLSLAVDRKAQAVSYVRSWWRCLFPTYTGLRGLVWAGGKHGGWCCLQDLHVSPSCWVFLGNFFIFPAGAGLVFGLTLMRLTCFRAGWHDRKYDRNRFFSYRHTTCFAE